MRSDSALIRVERLSHYFGEGPSRRQVLFENNLVVEPGEIVILTGPSGSGKTTLLTLVGALRSAQEGRIEVLGRELKGLDAASLVKVRRDIGFIFQMHNLIESVTALENVMVACQLKPQSGNHSQERAAEVLKRLGLEKRAHAKPQAMSGGQRQRVSIARALVNRPKLILADEPTAALDKESGRSVIELFQELSKVERCGVVIVTHDYRILDAADRIVNMVDGRIASDVRVEESVRICQFLVKCPAFSGLTPTALSGVADKVVREQYSKGTTIIRQGDPGEKFYIVREGSADVYRENPGGRDLVARLKEGEFFGETALITGEPRNATVVADTDIDLYTLDRVEFRAAIDGSPTFKDQLIRVLTQRGG
jgi:putative ABC transport system ATP-binding protein